MELKLGLNVELGFLGMYCRSSLIVLSNICARCFCRKRFTLTRLLVILLIISVITTIFSISYLNVHLRSTKRRKIPPLPLSPCRANITDMKNPFKKISHHTKDVLRFGEKVLVLVDLQFSKAGTKIIRLLEAVRIEYKVVSTGRNLPTLTHLDEGKFAVIIFENFNAYINMDNWNRQLLDKYCLEYNVGIIGFVPSTTDMITEIVPGFPLTMEYNQKLQDYKLNRFSDVWRVTKASQFYEGRLPGDWTVFRTNHSTYEPLSYSKKQSQKFSVSIEDDDNKPVSPVIYDSGKIDNIKRILFGSTLRFWLHRLLLLDSISYLSHGKLSVSLDRYIQIDIDDIFVGKEGIRMLVEDVEALAQKQELFQQIIPGFHFNLGFSGRYYLHGSYDEDAGDKKLLEYRDKFWWFGHMWRHEQAHKFNEEALTLAMQQNKKFAQENFIPVKQNYAVAPHHSGVYPVHEELYKAWRNVWDVKVTSTEEYPKLNPSLRRRGFIYKGIMVLPRQTCGLYTHTLVLDDYPGGKKGLDDSIKGGELFQSILYNPITIFMTHLSNYGNDRLALYTFEGALKFLKCWTNFNLKSLPPLQLALKYFEMFPEERDPIWQNPCNYKRHLVIWSANKTCEKLPSFMVVGPQKTGTTALYTFLAMHPGIVSNYNSPDTFEEVQFFNGNNYYKGLDWYLEFFPDPSNSTSPIIFEKSATYFDNEVVPQRAFSLLPKARIICILLNPAKRAYSWYQHMRSHDDPTALSYSFYDVISASDIAPRKLRDLRNRCLNPGMYAQHLVRWLDYYQPSQIFIIDGEQLKNDPINVMHRVQRFLQVEKYYDYSQHLRYDPKKGFFCEVLSNNFRKRKRKSYPPMTDEETLFLKQYYHKYNVALSKLFERLHITAPSWLEEIYEMKRNELTTV
ncbi:hypothetical protein LOTGIDRAFT_232790 [Lottia gigantea]|uniref:[heparan sulfate]-glucosamine N-sulfotransferase n=1 Tax=Lottia gigantea TaxID=225164 RepID=V4A9I8_LOTGI|nr:hypothetical protein LOTGIDRAFT_232790 [Lottia gigantea]ESO93397.1 hypothetical protein LOTGIDRAFT_232790 [Lottia gigantea]